LDGEEPGVAADVDHGLPGEIARHRVLDAPPQAQRVATEEVIRSGTDPIEVEVVEPGTELSDPSLDLIGVETHARQAAHASSALTTGWPYARAVTDAHVRPAAQ